MLVPVVPHKQLAVGLMMPLFVVVRPVVAVVMHVGAAAVKQAPVPVES